MCASVVIHCVWCGCEGITHKCLLPATGHAFLYRAYRHEITTEQALAHYKPQLLLLFKQATHFVDAHTVYFSQASDTFIKKIRQKPIETQNGHCVTNAAL